VKKASFQYAKTYHDDIQETDWNEDYELIPDEKLVCKIFDLSLIIGKRRTYILIQRVLDLVFGKRIRVNGLFDEYTIDRILEVCENGQANVMRNALVHYAANFIEYKTNPHDSRRVLQRIFQ
jgi:hypothetical protein